MTESMTFQQLAMHLVQNVKSLSACASCTLQMQDKELESKLKEISDVI
jgi:hypothetical protein